MRKFSTAAALLTLVGGTPALAQDWSLEAEAGLLYDSHLTFEEADIEQQQGDAGARFRVDAEVTPIDTRSFELDLGYTFDQTLYFEFDDFNIQSHRLGAGALARVAGARLGLDYAFSHVRLGGDALYDEHSLTPSVAGFLSDDVYARGYYRYSDKNFDVLTRRDSEGHAVGGSVMRFFNGRRGFVSGNASYETEDAVDPALDFDGFQIGATARIPLGQEHMSPRARLGVSYRERDYDNITPSIGARRTEDRLRANAGAEIPLTSNLRLEGDYRYTDRNSNFPAADYEEHRVLGTLVFELN